MCLLKKNSTKIDIIPTWSEMKIFRRKYYIAPKFQNELVKKMLGIGLLGNALLYMVNFAIYFHFNGYGQQLAREEKKVFYEFFHQQIDLINTYFLGLGIIFTLSLIIYGIKLSHRMAGPMYNIKMKFRQIQECKTMADIEKLHTTSFRKTDFFHDVAKEYNQSIVHLKSLVASSESSKIQERGQEQSSGNILSFPDKSTKDDNPKKRIA